MWNYFHQYFLWASCGSSRFKGLHSWFSWFFSKYRPVLNFASDYRTCFCIRDETTPYLKVNISFNTSLQDTNKQIGNFLSSCLSLTLPGRRIFEILVSMSSGSESNYSTALLSAISSFFFGCPQNMYLFLLCRR